jgi:hypothetical protein
MRSLCLVGAILWITMASVQAGDDGGPVVATFPETAEHFHVYLFKLKDNKIELNMSPETFCKQMDYGAPVFSDRSDEIKDNKVVPGKLNWVICRFKGK